MSNDKAERQVAKKGFGTTMVNRLREVDYASTDDLAKLAGVTTEQAYSRLMFLQSQEKIVVSTGKGASKLWSMADKAPPPAPAIEAKPVDGVAGLFNRSHGWKPSLAGFATPVAPIVKGDNLLVEYPEEWRHSALVTVLRTPDELGAAMCWNVRDQCYCAVPVTPTAIAKWSVKVVLINGEKNMQILENA